jgi:hypothetical protein
MPQAMATSSTTSSFRTGSGTDWQRRPDFTQDSPGVPGVAEEVDIFGTELV